MVEPWDYDVYLKLVLASEIDLLILNIGKFWLPMGFRLTAAELPPACRRCRGTNQKNPDPDKAANESSSQNHVTS